MNKSSIPNIITSANLCLGIIAIVLTFTGSVTGAALCILAGALIDRYDGKIARKFNTESLLGKELDSLSDLVSFGVAPAVLVWKIALYRFNFIGYIILLIYPICGSFRLARFNATEFNNIYLGVPITVAGSVMALDSIASSKFGAHPLFTVILSLLLSYLMVSSIRIKKI